MIPLTGHYQLYLYTEAADMRKAFDGLSGLIVSVLGRDPLDGSFYIFLNKRRNRMNRTSTVVGYFLPDQAG